VKDAAGIIRDLPHRYPFLMVDRVLELVPGIRAVAVKNVTADNPYHLGRGAGRYPEILLIEAMAQVGALAASPHEAVTSGELGEKGEPIPGYIAGINDARMARAPRVGEIVVFRLEFVAKMGAMVRFKGTASVGDELIAESGLTFTLPGGM